jgi:replicative DNA helicase
VADHDSARAHIEQVKEVVALKGGTFGIPTGLKAIDASYLTGMAPGHLIVVIGWPSRGKQEDVNKVIPTPSGYRRFGDIATGDYVFGRNGKPTLVTATHPQTSRTAYLVEFNDGTSTVVGPEHLWSIYCGTRGRKRDNLVTMTTQEILDRGLYRDRDGHKEYRAVMPLPQPAQYDKVDLPVDPYAMGALVGDGSYAPGSYNVVLSNNDSEIAAEISRRMPQNRVVEYSSGSSRRWSINGLYKTFSDNGWTAIRQDKRIPDVYMTAHYEARLDLLRGLMDTDGYAGHGNNKAEFSQSNEFLANQVAELVRSLGGVAKVSESATRPGQFKVSVWTPDNPFLLQRKSDAYTTRAFSPIKAIESITPVEDREMMCISVDADDSLYLTDHYIVTHNTWMTGYVAINAWKRGYRPMIVSLEMSPETMRDRLYTMMGAGRFDMADFTRGQLDFDEYDNWAKDYFQTKGEFIIVSNEGQSDITPNFIQAKVDQHRPDLVIVDYHQLLSDNARTKSTIEANRNASKELKLLAVRNSIPVVDIVSATMSDTSDQNGPPMLSQVAWSKAIEYDADHAFAVHQDKESGLIQIVCRKNRHGTEYDFEVDADLGRGIIREIY